MNKKLIDNYIALSLAITVFQLDQEKFRELKAANVYLDKLSAVIDQVRKDLHTLKRELIVKHHLDLKKVSNLEYSINGEVYRYTSDKLKKMTAETMQYYLMTVESISTERTWTDMQEEN